MNPYTLVGAGRGTPEALDLSRRLAAWHDAMVKHERRLEAGGAGTICDEDCAHGEARVLWAEALATFGERAHDFAFLRSRAIAGATPRSAGSRPRGRRDQG